MAFENPIVRAESLPRVDQIPFEALQRDYLKVGVIATAIFWLFPTIGLVIALLSFSYVDRDYPAVLNIVVPIVFLGLMLFHFWATIRGFREKQYALRTRDIVYKRGIFWKSMTTVPFNRVQHCEVKQGPVERLFGLSQLNIYTAGGSSSDLTIPGLLPQRANALKDFIVKKTAIDEEE